MEGKLIKVLDHYHLYDGDKAIATTIVGNPMLLPNLSLKNCQEIANGYDLDELADFYGAKAKGSVDFKLGANQGFEDGFQKALEILGDKKFTEEDMEDSFCEGKHRGIDDYNNRETGSLEYYDYINKKRTQQTEWDVEIVMGNPIGIGDKYTPDTKPKLDEDGCLILKCK